MTTFADLSPEAREFVRCAVVEAVRIAREHENEACADAIRALPTRDHNAGQWGGYGLGVQPCVKVEDAVAAIVGRGPGGASAEPGGAAPSGGALERALERLYRIAEHLSTEIVFPEGVDLVADGHMEELAAALREAERAYPQLASINAPATARSAAPEPSDGGGGAPAAGEREATREVCARLAESFIEAAAGRPIDTGMIWRNGMARTIADRIRAIDLSALRAPAPPTPPPHES